MSTDSMHRARIGPLRLEVGGLGLLSSATRRWVDAAFADLPSVRETDDGETGTAMTLRISFVADLEAPAGRPVFDPVGTAERGVSVTDQAGRMAVLPLPDPTADAVRVDPRMNLFVFEEWVLLPALRLAVERAGGSLVRAAAVAFDDRVIVVAAPMRTGKTRLVLELLHRGGRYLADDYLVLDGSGVVHGALAKVTLRDAHRAQLGDAWPGRTSPMRRLATTALGWAARATSSPFPALSVGLDRLATAGWVLGFENVPASTVAPAGVSHAGRLTDLVLLCPPSMPMPRDDQVPWVVAGLGEVDSLPNAAIAAAHATIHPGADAALFRPLDDVARAIAAATADADVHLVSASGDWLSAAVERLAVARGR